MVVWRSYRVSIRIRPAKRFIPLAISISFYKKKAMGKHDSDQFLHLALVHLKHALELSWTMIQSAGTSMTRNPGGTHGNVMGPFFRHISNT